MSAVMYFSDTRYCETTQRKVLIFGQVIPVTHGGEGRSELSRIATRCSHEWDCLNRYGARQAIQGCHLNLKTDCSRAARSVPLEPLAPDGASAGP
jgi:hypothetical protein